MKRFRSSWWCMRWLLACVTSVIEDNYNGDWEHGQKRLLYLSEGNIFLRIRLKHEEGHADKEKLWKELKKRAESREERQKVTLNGDGAENQTVFFSELRTWTVVTARKHPSEEMKHRSGRFGQHSRTHFELWQQAFFFPPWMKKKISVNVPVLHREQASENMFLGGGSAPTGNDSLSHGRRYFSETLSFNLHSIRTLLFGFSTFIRQQILRLSRLFRGNSPGTFSWTSNIRPTSYICTVCGIYKDSWHSWLVRQPFQI